MKPADAPHKYLRGRSTELLDMGCFWKFERRRAWGAVEAWSVASAAIALVRTEIPSFCICLQLFSLKIALTFTSSLPTAHLNWAQVAQLQRTHLPSRRHMSDPWVGKSPGEGPGNPLQYACLGNPMDRGVWCTTVHGVTEVSDMTWWLNNNKLDGSPL